MLSEVDGGPAAVPEVGTLAEVLPRAAARDPGRAVVLVDATGAEHALTYADLLDDACRVLRGLRDAGVREGDRVVLHVPDHRELLAAFWACVLCGAVPMPHTGGDVPWAALGRCWALTGDAPQPLDGLTRASWLGSVGGLALGAPDRSWHRAAPDDPALLAMTAGSSGPRKTVTLTHANVLARTAATVADNDLTEDSVTVNWMPLDHVGGLLMFHVRDVYLSCTQVHAQRGWVMADPRRWLDLLHRHGAHATWGTNSTLDLLAAHADKGTWDLSRLRYIMNGGEAVKAATIRRVLTALGRHGTPPTAVRPGWGMTESTAGILDNRVDLASLADSRFFPVGTPHPGMRVRVVDDSGRVLPEGRIGTMEVSGPSVTPGYVDGPQVGEWLSTGDLASIVDGVVTVTGSADDAMWPGGTLVHGHEIESTLLRLPFLNKLSLSACQVDGALVVFHDADTPDAAARITDLVATHHDLRVDQVVTIPQDRFPRTGTGKPQRARLRELARAR